MGNFYTNQFWNKCPDGSPEQMMFVVGATKASDLESIRKIIPNHFLLLPGVGAQGGSLADVTKFGINDSVGLLVNASRAVILRVMEMILQKKQPLPLINMPTK